MNEITSFGDWVRRRRKALDLTQAALARQVGCAVVTIKKIEQEERRPSREMAELLADSLTIPETDRDKFIQMARGQFVPALPTQTVLLPPDFLHQRPDPNPPNRPQVFGHERELNQLEGYLNTALTGNGQIVFLIGEAGRGKTTLLNEFARRVHQTHPDLLTVQGSCNAQAGVGDPYLPFRDMLGQLTGDLAARWATGHISRTQVLRLWEAVPHTIQTLIEYGPSLIDSLIPGPPLLRRLSAHTSPNSGWLAQLEKLITPQSDSSKVLEQSQLLNQVALILKQVAAQHPLLLLLDDLQWVDDASASLLFHLGRRLTGSRILLIGAYRPSEVAVGRIIDGSDKMAQHPLQPIVNEFKLTYGDIQLDLGQFIPAERRAFIDSILDSEPNHLDTSFRERLLWHTKGHPLFTVELLRDMQERGQLIQDETGHWVEGETEIDDRLPARVEAVIEQRIRRLDEPLQEMLLVAGVEGEIFTVQVLAHVLGLTEHKVLRTLTRQLEQIHRLTHEHSEIKAGDHHLNRYQFRHALFQQYLYEQLSQGERRLYHRQVAEALVALYADNLSEIVPQLAHHYRLAGDDAQAATYLVQAGDQARRLGAIVEAIRDYRAALARWPTTDHVGQVKIQCNLGECLLITGQTTTALAILEEAYQLSGTLGNTVEAGTIQRIMGRAYWEQGQREISLQHYHQALTLLEQRPETIELAMVLSSISQMHMLASESQQAVLWGERALAIAERLQAETVAIHALNNIGTALTLNEAADVERGLKLLQDSLDRALALNLPHDTCRAYVNLAEGLMWRGRYSDSYALFKRLLDYAKQMNTAMFEGVALARLTKLDWVVGQWDRALERRQQILAWREAFLPDTVPKVWASTLLGQMYSDLNQPQMSQQELETELTTARNLNEVQTTVPHLGQLARALATEETVEASHDLIQEFLNLIEHAPSSHVGSIPSLLFACEWLSSQTTARAVALKQCSLAQLEQIDAQFQTTETAAAISEGRAALALAQGDVQTATEQFEQAAELWQTLSRPYDQARALNGLGQALTEMDEIQRAKPIFQKGWAIVEDLAQQLQDPDLQNTFLYSPLAQKIRNAVNLLL